MDGSPHDAGMAYAGYEEEEDEEQDEDSVMSQDPSDLELDPTDLPVRSSVGRHSEDQEEAPQDTRTTTTGVQESLVQEIDRMHHVLGQEMEHQGVLHGCINTLTHSLMETLVVCDLKWMP